MINLGVRLAVVRVLKLVVNVLVGERGRLVMLKVFIFSVFWSVMFCFVNELREFWFRLIFVMIVRLCVLRC